VYADGVILGRRQLEHGESFLEGVPVLFSECVMGMEARQVYGTW
jgi:hypothetical protein